jgi:large repetitive protein
MPLPVENCKFFPCHVAPQWVFADPHTDNLSLRPRRVVMSSWRPQGGPVARRLAFRPQVLTLEERAVPSATATDTSSSVPAVTTPTNNQIYAVGAAAGNPPLVNVYNADGSLRYSFMAYSSSFLGGVRVAVGDVTGDGVPDIVTAPGPGMAPQIKVFDGTSGAEVANYMAYHESFTGGVYVAVADVDGDGHADIITGAGQGGGPHVKVMSGAYVVPPIDGSPTSTTTSTSTTPTTSGLPGAGDAPGLLGQWYAYAPNFLGGVRVAAADINGDGHADIITGAGPGGGPHVKAIDGETGQLLYQFYAFAPNYHGGVYVTAGDVVGDGKADVAVGSGTALSEVNLYDNTGTLVRDYTIDEVAAATQGLPVAMADVNGNGKDDLLLSVGTNVEIRDPETNATLNTITPFDPTILGGVFVG